MSSDAATRLGALAWLLATQFFITQVVVASAWSSPYSLKTRVISDLGNTRCGPGNVARGGVCSPWHAAMNASFVVIGVTMAAGAILARRAFRRGWARWLAVILFTAAGIGAILVGIYPENENNARHTFGAAMNFLAGNTAMILFGLAAPSRSTLRWLSIAAGVGGLAATFLFARGEYLGLGPGGMERIAAYTISGWQVVSGMFLWRTEQR